MNMSLKHYTLLASIFDYPDDDFSIKVAKVKEFLSGHSPLAAGEFHSFADHMMAMDLLSQQELFIRSFDVQSLTTLDIGYILFGDDYKRGELLVNLNREHKAVNNDCGTELADYLPNVLRLIPLIRDSIFLAEFVQKILAPALFFMIRSFDKDRVDEKEKFYFKKDRTIIQHPTDHYTIYQKALKAQFIILSKDFDIHFTDWKEDQSDFLRNIETEISLEDK